MLAVLGALFANAVIAVLKLAAALMTGSSGMMAEALHSIADTTNQVFLLLGLRFYKRPASKKHPFGYGKERFFWSFIAAIFIFGVGSTYAIYEGYFVCVGRLFNCAGHLPGNEGSASRRPNVH
jgi:cation diffusion facilitator family transporter